MASTHSTVNRHSFDLMPAAQFPHNASYELLGIAEQHERLVKVVERIVDTCETRVHAPLDDHDRVGLVHVENGHAEDRARLIGTGGGVGHVVGSDDQRN